MDRSQIAAVARLSEVAALVMTDSIGALLSSRGALAGRDLDGEALGAITTATLRTLSHCGETLGLGTLYRVVVTGAHYDCVIAMDDRGALAVYLNPGTDPGLLDHALAR